ncbi:hypothetical protein [Heyndrickxia camelliae]|uniref:Multi-TM2 domain-containing protein n=1 Tax=Heyndrickxia camelliae TaxID=1707093 RepID=A0A2N3LHF8_9BACI|nr:hypothetical protein [Heyndrickxia camelliae]PKR84014.1 hypothetical protein CWO92_15960 [Heyndrickxia camelliae]
MNNSKNPITAFLLGFFPGGGLLYLGIMSGFIYTISVCGLAIIAILLVATSYDMKPALAITFIGFVIYVISVIHTAVRASRQTHSNGGTVVADSKSYDSERFYTILLSFIPGLGHFQLGLMNRGLTILTSFLGMGVMVVFITALTHRAEFLVFLAFLPIIWVYGFFDATRQLTKKQSGEQLVDRSIFEEFEMRKEDGKKSRSIATFLSIFPGAGHLYLGLQKRGIQLMAAFLFSIYILDILRLGIFLFLVPIIWFYSFFDGLQKASKYGKEEMEDKPVISYLINHQRWVGIGLIILGLYYLISYIVLPVISPMIYNAIHIDIDYWFSNYFQTGFVCLLLIGGGIKLMVGTKRKGEEENI